MKLQSTQIVCIFKLYQPGISTNLTNSMLHTADRRCWKCYRISVLKDNIKTTLNKMAVRMRQWCNCIRIVFSDRTSYDQSYYLNHFWSHCQYMYHHLTHMKTHKRCTIHLLHTTQMLFHPVHSKANKAVVLVWEDVTPRCVMVRYPYCRATCYHHLLPWWRQLVPQKCWSSSTRQRDVTSHHCDSC